MIMNPVTRRRIRLQYRQAGQELPRLQEVIAKEPFIASLLGDDEHWRRALRIAETDSPGLPAMAAFNADVAHCGRVVRQVLEGREKIDRFAQAIGFDRS